MISEDQGEKNNGEAPPMPTIDGRVRYWLVWTGVSLASTVLHLAEPGALGIMRLDCARVEPRLLRILVTGMGPVDVHQYWGPSWRKQ